MVGGKIKFPWMKKKIILGVGHQIFNEWIGLIFFLIWWKFAIKFYIVKFFLSSIIKTEINI